MKLLSEKDKLTESDISSIGSYEGWLIYCNGKNLHRKYIMPLEKKEVVK